MIRGTTDEHPRDPSSRMESDPPTVTASAMVRNRVRRTPPGRLATSLLLLFAATGSLFAASFDEQRSAVSASPATQPESAILALLKAGLAENKPSQAIAEAQKWLRQNLPTDASLLYYAGRAAELSGEWKDAVALYQQYLQKAEPTTETASDAILAVHVLLIDRLNDTGAAYAFGRNEGPRLAVNPQMRQFDRWFLSAAVDQDDAEAVAERLRACIEAGVPGDLLIARYDEYLWWLLASISTYLEQPQSIPVTQSLYRSVKALAAAITFDDELKLRLDWAVSVKYYNLEKQAGKNPPLPIAEAKDLLARYPRYARWVQDGWAGGGPGIHHRGDPKKYWPHEVDAKLAPIVEAASKLAPLDLAGLLQTWQSGYYANGPKVMDVKAVGEYVRAHPEFMNSKSGVFLHEKEWQKLSVEEARALAPQLAQNPSSEATLVRAIAAGGNDLDNVMAAYRGPEAWRLDLGDLNGRNTDQLWHYTGRPGESRKRDQEIAKTREMAKQIAPGDVKPEAPAAERLAAFKKLWADFRSPQPKIPCVRARLLDVFRVTPEALPEMLEDPSVEARMLVREAISKGFSGPGEAWAAYADAGGLRIDIYDPSILRKARQHRSMEQMKTRSPKDYKPHPLEAVLRQAVARQLKQGEVEAWLAMAWINAQFVENNGESVELARALVASPAWKALPLDTRCAARAWFKGDALTDAQAAYLRATDPDAICKDLRALPKEADAATAAAALRSTIEGIRKAPERIAVAGLERLAAVKDDVFRAPDVMELMVQIADPLRALPQVSGAFDERLRTVIAGQKQPDVLHRTAPYLWRSATLSQKNALPDMLSLTESMVEVNPSAASALALCGLATMERKDQRQWFKRESDPPRLKAIRAQAAMKMGLMVIPVEKTDPAYAIYKSQAEWLSGNEDSAWALCDANWDRLLPVHRELSIPYLTWVLKQVIYSREETRQEGLVKALLAWAAEPNTPLSLTQRIELEIAYGDIAVQRGRLQDALKLYTRTAQNEAYKGVPERYQASLRRVRVERMAKDFDAALNTLGELEMARIPQLWSAIRYARAEVYYDMEEYDDAAKDIESILAREPNHGEAKILQGKVQLKRKKLMEATEVELGTVSSQQFLVPGEALKVTLTDPTLAVSGAGTEIEVVVWTTSGDREHFFLRQFGDQKTKFRGEVATALGAPASDDRVLQVVGDDQVFYAFSERFRKKMNDMDERRGGPITVASDALLMASARKLLSEAEQRVADMKHKMETLRGSADSVKAKVAAEAGEKAARGESGLSDASQSPVETRVKPGNPIHIRVIDPDRSRTAQIDELTVSVESSSGDAIQQVTLKETGTHTGWFEGSVPTAGAQAMAFGAHSEPGRNPNMVISATPGYPAWRPVANSTRNVPEFTVDLNDNVELGELTITAREEGFKLKAFALRTGMNTTDLTTVAIYPTDQLTVKDPWRPSVVVMNDTDQQHTQNTRSAYELSDLAYQVEVGWMSQQFAQGAAGNVAGPSEAMTTSIPSTVKWKRQNRFDTSHVIYRFRGYFYETAPVKRRLRLDLGKYAIPATTHPSVKHPAQFMLAIDGKPITQAGGELDGAMDLKPGVHRFEIWATGWNSSIGFGRTIKLQANLGDPDGLVDCPDSYFDPATFPDGVLPLRNAPASATALADGTGFKVKFAPGSRTRLLKLMLVKYEGPVPALNKLALTRPDGSTVLPVANDFAELNKNDILEIRTGDKVVVRYTDDRFVSKEKETHERFLNVAFSNASVCFEFFEMRKNNMGDMEPYHEELLRFAHGEKTLLTINDPDMDVSVKPDTLTFTLMSETGGERRFTAVEDEKEPGTFRAWITPVPGTPTADDQMQVAAGGTLTAVYRDAENTSPGVPTDRRVSARHAAFAEPKLLLSHATVTSIDPKEAPPAVRLRPGFTPIPVKMLAAMSTTARRAWEAAEERITPRWSLKNTLWPAQDGPANDFEVVQGQQMDLAVLAPHLALRAGSTVDLYLQTDAGRAQAESAHREKDPKAPAFDIEVPGTLKLSARIDALFSSKNEFRETPRLPIYLSAYSVLPSDPSQARFICSVPLIAGLLPEHGVVPDEERADRKLGEPLGLVVRPGERVHVGYRYQTPDGKEQWLTASAKVITHPVLDVMEEDYRSSKTSAYVGENLYLRVVDLGADVSDRSDTVDVLVQARSGAKYRVELREVDPHSGVFQGACTLTYVKAAAPPPDGQPAETSYDVKRDGFPVVYGDEVGARYTDAAGRQTETHFITISRGADGTVMPFSKRYDNPEVAMRTQFALAESYLELAKHRRKLGETEAAAREFDRAKQLLTGAMDQFRDPATRAHAEYMLGNMTQEEADSTAEAPLKEDRYRAALSRFMTVTGSYPDTLDASKAQFKIATVYERLKEPDIAAQEYVKLAYKYPESEFLALSMARLGTHFLRKAEDYENQAKPLLEKTEDKDATFEGQALQKMATREYLKSANIFARLQERFPDHELAGQGGLRAGQAYMRAGDHQQAVHTLMRVINNENYDGPEVRAEAMYWVGICYEKLQMTMQAYSIYKRLTYDFPESKWASFARGQLSQERLLKLETDLEIKRLEEGR